jgi:hypothetical protein
LPDKSLSKQIEMRRDLFVEFGAVPALLQQPSQPGKKFLQAVH